MQEYNPIKHIDEAVIRVDSYVDDVTAYFSKVIKQHFLGKKYSLTAFCEEINQYFWKYNIIFNSYMVRPFELLRPDLESGIVNMETGTKTLQIRINVCINFLNIFKNADFFYDVVLPDFKLIVAHELIHRVQFMKNKIKYIPQVKADEQNFITYDELMTYAFQTIEEFRLSGINDSNIISLLKKGETKYSPSFTHFHNNLRIAYPKQYKQYIKYIFEYLTGDGSKNKYTFIENTHQSETKEVFKKNLKGVNLCANIIQIYFYMNALLQKKKLMNIIS